MVIDCRKGKDHQYSASFGDWENLISLMSSVTVGVITLVSKTLRVRQNLSSGREQTTPNPHRAYHLAVVLRSG